MTIEIVMVIWQVVFLSLSMCGKVYLTNAQLFFPLICLIFAIVARVYCLKKKREYQEEIQKTIREIEELVSKQAQDNEDN